MRAFLIAIRAAVSFYNDLFLLVGLSLFWWLTGGILMGAAGVFLFLALLAGDGLPWWLAPLIAIPTGPAMAAMSLVARRNAREIHVDRSYYTGAFKSYWRPALALSAIGCGVLSLLLLNVVFYFQQSNPYIQMLTFLWAYLAILWLAVQFYVYPVLVALEQPRILPALRTAAVATFANPFFSTVLVFIGVGLAALSTMLAAPLLMIWPALMALLGEHALRLILQRAGVDPNKGEA